MAQTNLFTPVDSGLPAIQQPHAAWGDFDNDGYPDLAITGFLNGGAVALVFHNNHNGTFTDANAGLQSYNGGKPSWGDFNRDGFLDLLIADSTNRLYLNNGNGTFTPTPSALPMDTWKNEAAWGDYDNDGHLDVFSTGAGLFRNNTDGTFTNVPGPVPPLMYGSIDWGDFDNDGDLDRVITGRASNGRSSEPHICKVYRNDGPAGFVQVAAFTGIYLASALWGDYDNDGYLDLLVIGGIGDVGQLAKIYHNNGNQTFTDINAGLTPVTFGSAAWGDFDNDGYLDAIITGQGTNSVSVTALYRNNHDNTFSLVPAGLTNVVNSFVSWADVDQDGDLDLLVGGYATPWATPVLQLYRNNSISNTPPLDPEALPATFLTNGDVALRWAAPADAQTPTTGLDYNLRLGTSPGGIDVIAPQA
ncbi:MAG: regulatory domain of in-like proprotein convertase, partial [Pedosphaera sp.]|nr:regulatory domain of in-like proprotein convertase [Pedosphaera sp.]